MLNLEVARLLDEVGLAPEAAARTHIEGADPILPSVFPVAECAAVALGAFASAAALLWEERTGTTQEIEVSVPRAGASLLSFLRNRLVDGTTIPWPAATNPLVSLYQCADGRWIHLHGAYEHLAARTEQVLGLSSGPDREDVRTAVAQWEAQALEDALAEIGTCGAMVRSVDEWRAHEQGRIVGDLARVEIERIGDAPPEPVGDGLRPLGGVRTLDLTRMLAGPTHGRLLAEQGAEVLLVSSLARHNIDLFVLDTSHGKRSAALDLDQPADLASLRSLAGDADVFAQGYRAGALEGRGLGPGELAELRPGIIYVTINCYGDVGPWRERRGWEQLAQSVTGVALENGTAARPELIAAAACDYITGHLAAVGTAAALHRRATEGGSWHVRASLCQTGTWFTRQRRVDKAAAAGVDDTSAWSVVTETPWGELQHMTPVAQLSETPARWDLPTAPVGTHAPEWLSSSG